MDEIDLQTTLVNIFETLRDAREEIEGEPDVCSLADMMIDLVDEGESIASIDPLPPEGNTAKLAVVTNNGSRFQISIVKTR